MSSAFWQLFSVVKVGYGMISHHLPLTNKFSWVTDVKWLTMKSFEVPAILKTIWWQSDFSSEKLSLALFHNAAPQLHDLVLSISRCNMKKSRARCTLDGPCAIHKNHCAFCFMCDEAYLDHSRALDLATIDWPQAASPHKVKGTHSTCSATVTGGTLQLSFRATPCFLSGVRSFMCFFCSCVCARQVFHV